MTDLPEPLTPPDCDLSGFSFMPLDVVRLADSDFTALSTGDEFKAAVLLWGKSWTQVPAASLPDDPRVLARFVGLSVAEWSEIAERALHGFVKCSDGRLYHPTVAEKALEAHSRRRKQRQKALSRWSKIKAENAGAMPRHSHGSNEVMQGTGTGTGTGTGKEASKSSGSSERVSAVADDTSWLTDEAPKAKPTSKPIPKPKPQAPVDEHFAKSWAAWTRKDRSSKAKSLAAWHANKATGEDKFRAVSLYLASKDARKDGGAFVKGFELWLRDRLDSWLEQIAAKNFKPVQTLSLPKSPEWWAKAAAKIATDDPDAWRAYGAQCEAGEDFDAPGVGATHQLTTTSGTAREKLSRIVERLHLDREVGPIAVVLVAPERSR